MRILAFTIELYAKHIEKPADVVYQKLQETELLEMLYTDYEDLHGMSPEYMNNYFDKCFGKQVKEKPVGKAITKALIIAEVIELIAKKYIVNLKEATKMYYTSNTSKMMSDDNTAMYGDSALNVFSVFEQYH